ncbi:MAG: glycosyltransferase [Ilumatobacteraceae bacterium]
MIITPPSFAHLAAMSDGVGTFEHAELIEPRRAGGYCTDDLARVLVVTVREPRPTRAVADLGRMAYWFLADAQGVAGRVHNRRNERGRWTDRRGVEDCWGRTVWAFGSAVRHAPDDWMRQSAMSYFDRGAQQRSPHRRAMVFAALGAAEVLEVHPRHAPARRLLADAVEAIGPLGADPAWPWPEARLTYANAALPEVLIAAGQLLDRPDVLADGIAMLRWLLTRETLDGHHSATAVGGAGPGDRPPVYDQQPIEVAAMADACTRALDATGAAEWRDGIERAAGWFLGANDSGAVMWDSRTGGGYDGLERDGVNRNEGAESTLALIATMQRALGAVPTAA